MIQDVEVAIEVPSGKLVVENDLRHLFRDVIEAEHLSGQGTAFWMKGHAEAYGKAGLLHGFVGNSCPGVYKLGDTLYIGNQPWNKEDFDIDSEPYVKYPRIPGKRVAGVCTDLWWYSICDWAEFVRRGGKIDRWGPDIIKVKPGRYILSHHWPYTTTGDSYRPQRMIYATIKRDYRPLKPWLLPEEKLFMEIKRILPEVKHVWIIEHDGRHKFNLFVVVDNQSGHYSARFDVPTELVIDKDYGSVAVLIKKKLWQRRSWHKRYYQRYKTVKRLSRAERKRQHKLAMEILNKMTEEQVLKTCPQCEKGKLGIIKRDITLEYRGRTKTYKDATTFKCSLCDYEAAPDVNENWQRYCGQIDYYEDYNDWLKTRVFEKRDDTIKIRKTDIDKGIPAYKLFHDVGLAKSRSDARRLIKGGGAYVNSTRIKEHEIINNKHVIAQEMILQAGKKPINIQKIIVI